MFRPTLPAEFQLDWPPHMSLTLRKGIKILESIVLSDTPRGISELSRDIQLDKSGVQRIIQTLADEGYIEKTTDTNKYRPTLRLWELGSRVIAANEMRRQVHPILRYASKVSGLTAYFAYADGNDIIYLDKIDGEKGRTASSEPGRRLPIYAAASGRAVLAFYDQNHIDAALKGAGDLVVAQELRQDLSTIRTRLFATTERGATARIGSVAAPIWSSESLPIGSIVLTSDASTLPPSDYDRVGAIVVAAAEQATRVLGGSFPTTTDEAP